MHWTEQHPDRDMWSPGRLAVARTQTQEEYEALYGRGERGEPRLKHLAIREQLDAYREGFLSRSGRRNDLRRLRQEASWWKSETGRRHWSDSFSDHQILEAKEPSALLQFLADGGEYVFGEYLYQRSQIDHFFTQWWSEEILPQMTFVRNWTPQLGQVSWNSLHNLLGRKDNLLQGQADLLAALQRGGDRKRVEEFAETPVLAPGPISVYTRAAALLPWAEFDRVRSSEIAERTEAEVWWQGFCGIARGSTRCQDPNEAWRNHLSGGLSPLQNFSPLFVDEPEKLQRLMGQTESLIRNSTSSAALSFGELLEREFRGLSSLRTSEITYVIQQTALRYLA